MVKKWRLKFLVLNGSYRCCTFPTKLATADLNHPHIVRVTIGEEDGQQYLAMEYVAGLDLQTLYQGAPLSNRRGRSELWDQCSHALACSWDCSPRFETAKRSPDSDGNAKSNGLWIAVAFAENKFDPKQIPIAVVSICLLSSAWFESNFPK